MNKLKVAAFGLGMIVSCNVFSFNADDFRKENAEQIAEMQAVLKMVKECAASVSTIQDFDEQCVPKGMLTIKEFAQMRNDFYISVEELEKLSEAEQAVYVENVSMLVGKMAPILEFANKKFGQANVLQYAFGQNN